MDSLVELIADQDVRFATAFARTRDSFSMPAQKSGKRDDKTTESAF